MIDYNPIGTEILRWLIVGLVFGGWTVAVSMAARWLTMRTRKTDGEWKVKYEAAREDALHHRMECERWEKNYNDLLDIYDRKSAKLKGIASLAATGGE
jgi:hypothetical protein